MSQLEDLLQQCTVKLTLRGGWGTGFFVAPEWILTCAHVVQQAAGQPIQVRWQNQENWAQAVVERSLPDPYDLALLRVTIPIDTNPPCVYLDTAIQSCDPLYLFGYPDQDFLNGCPVTFSCEGLTGDEPALIKFALGQVRPGMSGSPLLNQRTGKVCGIVKFTRDRSFDLGGGAISASAILSKFPELVELQQQFHRQDQRWSRSFVALLDTIPENLPRSGVVEFVGRAEAMEQLDQMLQQGDRVAASAIAGMGGMGKTELALQYALAYRQRYPAGICWLQARAVEVGTQLVRFAKSQLSLNPLDTFELLDQVKYCWRNWRSGDALLIFDDVTDYDAIEPYLPPLMEPRFKVLLTTRLRLGKSVNQLELDVLDEVAALALLQSLVGGDRIQKELENSKQICAWLGYLPLGLELVGRYLARKPDLSMAEVLRRLDAKRIQARALQTVDADMTAQLGVAAAFELSWEVLDEPAKQIGCLLSLFALAPVPWRLVEQILREQDPEELEDIRDEGLCGLHLLQHVDQNIYHLHQLIREFFRHKLEQLPYADELIQKFCQTSVDLAEKIPKNPNLEQITANVVYIPHLEEIANYFSNHLNGEDLKWPFIGLANFYQGQGLYAQAAHWLSLSLTKIEARFGNIHPDIATTSGNLGLVYYYQGRYKDSEPLLKRALELEEHFHGKDHPDVAVDLTNLADLYREQGQYAKAESLLKRALTISVDVLGEEHIDVVTILNNLALIYSNQENYSAAEPLLLKTLELNKQLLGEKDPRLVSALNNLAEVYRHQNRYEEAEILQKQAQELAKQVLGEEHPDFAMTLNNLGLIYYAQGRYEDSASLHEQSLELNQRLLDENHPRLAFTFENLALAYDAGGSYRKAEPLYRKALQLKRQILGDKHPQTIQNIWNLGVFYCERIRYGEAEPLLEEVLNCYHQDLGRNHPKTISCYKILTNVRSLMKRPVEENLLQVKRKKGKHKKSKGFGN